MARGNKSLDALPKRQIRRYGWKPDLPDGRDLILSPESSIIRALPPLVDLRGDKANVRPWNQSQLGSCTSHGTGFVWVFAAHKSGHTRVPMPSRLFIYFNERVMEGTVNEDSGAYIRDGMKSIATVGVASERSWPYNIDRFTEQPPPSVYTAAKKHRAIRYMRVPQDLAHMKACLAAGFPFTFGFTVYSSFEQVGADGMVPMPAAGEQILGGHCVAAVGYDDARQLFIIRNSWGEEDADHGYRYFPYAYLLDRGLSSDFWTCRSAT